MKYKELERLVSRPDATTQEYSNKAILFGSVQKQACISK